MSTFLRDDVLGDIGQMLQGAPSTPTTSTPAVPAPARPSAAPVVPFVTDGIASQPVRGDVVNGIGQMLEAQKPGWAKQTFVNEPLRGGGQAAQSYLTLGALGGSKTAIKLLAKAERGMRSIPTSDNMEAFQQSKGFLESIGAAINNPDVIPQLATQSAVSYGFASAPFVKAGTEGGAAIGGLAGTALPGVGNVVGAGIGASAGALGGAFTGSLLLDATSTFLGELRDAGVDLGDEKQLEDAFNNPKLVAKAKASALKHGIPVAILDAISLRMAGTLKGPMDKMLKGASGATKKAAHFAAEPISQGLMGGTGETLGQLAQGKKLSELSAPDIVGEAAGEFGSTPMEIMQNQRVRDFANAAKNAAANTVRKQGQPPAAPAPQPPALTPLNPTPTQPTTTEQPEQPTPTPKQPADLSWLDKWVQENPEKAKNIAQLQAPSRKKFQQNGFPVELEQEDRQRALERIRELHNQPATPTPTPTTTPEQTGSAPGAEPPATAVGPTPDAVTTQAPAPNIGTTPTPEATPPESKSVSDRAQEILDSGEADTIEDATAQAEMEFKKRKEAQHDVPQEEEGQQKAPLLNEPTQTSATQDAEPSPGAQPSNDGTLSEPKDEDAPGTLPTTTPESSQDESPDVKLSRRIEKHMREGGSLITRELLNKFADEEYGGTRAEGKYGPSDVDDAMETAVHRFLRNKTDPTVDLREATATVSALEVLKHKLPTQINRSGEKTDFQQFSTPPDYAYAANWIANINKGDTVLEPSAGTGGLLTHAQNSGAKTIANEISDRRHALLKTFGADQTHLGDAEHIDVKTQKNKPTVVVMNPPFSRSAHRIGGTMDIMAGSRHVIAALKAVQPGGRVVAIVGGGMTPEKTSYKPFFDQLAKDYNFRANVLVDGAIYKKYGTSFDSRVLVIDKPAAGEKANTQQVVRGKAETIPKLLDLLEGVRNDRPAITPTQTAQDATPGADQPQSDAAPTEAPDGGNSQRAVSGGDGQAGDAPVSPGGSAARPSATGPEAGERPNDAGNVRVDGRSRPDRGASGRGVQPSPGESGGRSGSADDGRAGANTTSNPATIEPDVGGAKAPEQSGVKPAAPASESDGGTPPGSPVVDKSPKAPTTPIATVREPGVESGMDQIAGSLADVFTDYKPSTKFENAKPHPGKLSESVAMRSVALPKITYALAIDPKVIAAGAASDAQLEGAAMALQANEQRNGDGSRRAVILGDGTGVGKTREGALILMDNYNRGRKLGIWLTPNDLIANDLKENYVAVGGKADGIHIYERGMKVPTEGVLVITYGRLANERVLLNKETGKPDPSNYEIIKGIMGSDFDGPMLFDESHLMENANAQQEEGARGVKDDSKRGRAGVQIQNDFPDARVSYLSATAATEPGKLGYAVRLGLWGPGTQFPAFESFAGAASEGGTAFLEMLAMHLKSKGGYVARSIALNDGTEKGSVKVERVDVALSDRHRAVYDECAKMWRRVLTTMTDAAELLAAGDKDAAAAVKGSRNQGILFSAQQRFFETLITSFKLPKLIENIEADLAKGEAAVVQLTRTYGSDTDKKIKELGDTPLEELDISPISQLSDLVKKIFPIHRVEKYRDENGKKQVRLVLQDGHPVVDPEALAMRDAIIADLAKMKILPRSPIDQIIDHFGVNNVAEISGRNPRTVKDQNGKMVKQPRSPAHRVIDKEAFADDKKKILVFSDAGGTGVGYHASNNSINQRHRNHYLLQPGWKSNAAIQGLGRTHRTNQASAPTWKLVTTDIPGEKRFISTIARRLEQMGAITRGTRKGAATGIFKASDNLESSIAKDAAHSFLLSASNDALQSVKRATLEEELGLDLSDPKKLPDIRRLLNRMMMLDLETQDLVYSELGSIIEQKTDEAKRTGRYDTGIEDFKAESVTERDQTTVHTDKVSGSSSQLVTFDTQQKIAPFPFKDLSEQLASLAQGRGDRVRFVEKIADGKVLALVEAGSPRNDPKTGISYPQYRGYTQIHGKLEYVDVSKVTSDTYKDLGKGEAIDKWNEAVKALPTTKPGRLYLVTDPLPIWKELGSNPKIIRVTNNDGKVYLGRQLNKQEFERFSRARGLNKATGPITTQEIAGKALSGTLVKLQNGLALERRKVGGETRLEITGVGGFEGRSMQSFGAFNEKVGGFGSRWFVPIAEGKATDETIRVLNNLIKYAPVSSFESEEESDAYKPSSAPVQQGPQGKAVSTSPSAAPRKLKAEWIVRWMSKQFDVPMRYGRVTLAGAAAIYKAKAEVIRVRGRFWGNLYVHLHELAHHIDKSGIFTGEVGKGKGKLTPDMMAELGTLDYDPKAARAKEGFAEFIARTYANNEDLSQIAPKFTDHFYNELLPNNPRLAADLETLRGHIRAYQSQTALERVIGNISDDGRPERVLAETWLGRRKDELAAFGRELYTQFVEQGAAVEEFQHKMESLGEDYNKDVGPYDQYRQTRRAALKWGFDAFQSGAFLLNDPGNVIGPSITDVFKEIEGGHDPEVFQQFIAYALSAHALEVHKDVKDSAGNITRRGQVTGISNDDAKEIVAQFDHRDDFKRAHAALSLMNDALLDVQLEQKSTSPKQVEAMRKTWGDHFLPLLKVKQLDGKTASLFKDQTVDLGSTLRRRKGSAGTIINPVASTMWRYLQAYKNSAIMQVRNSIIDASLRVREKNQGNTDSGTGALVEPYPYKMKALTISAEEIRTQLEAAGIDQDQFDNIEPETLLSIYRPDVYADKSDPTVWQRYEGEKLKQYKVHPELADAVAQLTRIADVGAILRAGAAVTRAVATGATTLNPNFLLRNTTARDVGTYLLQGEGSLLDRLAALPVEYYKSAQHYSGIKADPMRALFDRMHASTTAIDLGYRPGAKEMTQSIKPKSTLAKAIVLNPTRAMIRLGEIGESNPRMAAFNDVLTKGKFPREAIAAGKNPPRALLLKAINAAADSTTDFSKRGEIASQLGIFMFANPIMQGNVRFFRNFTNKELRAKNGPYIGAAALATVAYWLAVKDTDWWKEGEDWLKYTHFVLGDGGFRYALPQEFAHFVFGPILSTLDGLYQKDKTLGHQLAGQLWRTAGNQLPGVPVIQPPIEVLANYDLFRERPLETARMRSDLKPIDRYNEGTLKASRLLANVFVPLPRSMQLSPIMTEHLLNGYTGGAFRTWVRPVEKALSGDLHLRDIPGIQGFTTNGENAASPGEFYDALQQARETVGSLEKQGVTSGPAHDRLHELKRYDDIMADIRKKTGNLSNKEDRFKFEKYTIGLSRRAMGYTELPRYPDPIRHPADEKIVKDAVDASLSRDVLQATAPPPVRSKLEPLAKYQARVAQWKKERDRSTVMLESAGYSQQDLGRMLTEKARSENWNTALTEQSGKLTSFGERLRRLRTIKGSGTSTPRP